MDYETLLVSQRGPATVITINRSDARNALNPEVIREMLSAVSQADADDSSRVVILTGAGEKAFCAGGDLGGGAQGGFIEQHLDRGLFSELTLKLRSLTKPVIASVNGHALGGGFGLALACDVIVASESAEFGTPEINLGLWPYIITAFIKQSLPPKVALEMMMRGKRISARDGERWGFVNEVVAPGELHKATDALAEDIASKSPIVLRLGKASFYAAQDLATKDALAYLESQLTIGLQAEDVAEGIQAFFQKRKPEWKGR
jgi:enoyl-CoA hydratase/carnithine racemase